jgi:uracil permease
VVIGPTVAIIGLSLAGNAIGDALHGAALDSGAYVMTGPVWANLICALITLFTVIACSVFGKKMAKLIPFIIGIAAGYVAALVITLIGGASNEALKLIDFAKFSSMKWVPDFTFIEAFKGFESISIEYIGTVAVAYVPVAFVVFAEHIADHKNLSTIIDRDLLKTPGLHRTLLGDGIGSIAGAFFGGCPNTTYGESVGCVAITGNASVVTILCTAILAIVASFFAPFVTLLSTIPSCVMGGVCITLYGFIAVSGLKMLQPVDLNDNRNLFTASVILIAGIGGMTLKIGPVTLTEVAAALILGILVNVIFNRRGKEENAK